MMIKSQGELVLRLRTKVRASEGELEYGPALTNRHIKIAEIIYKRLDLPEDSWLQTPLINMFAVEVMQGDHPNNITQKYRSIKNLLRSLVKQAEKSDPRASHYTPEGATTPMDGSTPKYDN